MSRTQTGGAGGLQLDAQEDRLEQIQRELEQAPGERTTIRAAFVELIRAVSFDIGSGSQP